MKMLYKKPILRISRFDDERVVTEYNAAAVSLVVQYRENRIPTAVSAWDENKNNVRQIISFSK